MDFANVELIGELGAGLRNRLPCQDDFRPTHTYSMDMLVVDSAVKRGMKRMIAHDHHSSRTANSRDAAAGTSGGGGGGGGSGKKSPLTSCESVPSGAKPVSVVGRPVPLGKRSVTIRYDCASEGLTCRPLMQLNQKTSRRVGCLNWLQRLYGNMAMCEMPAKLYKGPKAACWQGGGNA